MKRLLGIALVGLALSVASYADVNVHDIVVNQSAKTPGGTNLRVVLDSPTNERLRSIELQVRDHSATSWRTLKTWYGPMTVKAGEKLALDYFATAEGGLDSTLQQNSYELRAVVHSTTGEIVSLPQLHLDQLPTP